MSLSAFREYELAEKTCKDTNSLASQLVWQSDLRLLHTADHADFTICCGNRKWLVHKVILMRCPYYAAILKKDMEWKEKMESTSVIEGFEPFEVNWLIRYIYSAVLDPQDLVDDLPSKSYLEVCVRLWTLGDYFRVELLAKAAVGQMENRVRLHVFKAMHVANILNGIPFMDELEAAIRLAWAPDYAEGAVRTPLLVLFQSVQPFLHKHAGCVKLLEEVPDFSVDFAKLSLGIYDQIQDCSHGCPCISKKCSGCMEDFEIYPKTDPYDSQDNTKAIIESWSHDCDAFCDHCVAQEGPEFKEFLTYNHSGCPECKGLTRK